MPYANYSAEEVESKGEAIYAQRIRAQVEPNRHGEFVIIDIETGEYEIDPDDLAATKRLLAKNPSAVFYGLRVGLQAAYTIGGLLRTAAPTGHDNRTDQLQPGSSGLVADR